METVHYISSDVFTIDKLQEIITQGKKYNYLKRRERISLTAVCI